MVERVEKYLSKGKSKETYSLYGMPIVLQIWAYEIVPIIAQRYATKCGETQPRILKYSWNQTPTSDDIVSDVFELIKIEVHDALMPIEVELEKDYVRAVKFDAIEQKLAEHAAQLLDMKKEIAESIAGFLETTNAIYEGVAVLNANWEKKEDKDGNQDEDENDDQPDEDDKEIEDEKDDDEKDDEGKDDEDKKEDQEGKHDANEKEDQAGKEDRDGKDYQKGKGDEEDNEGKTVSPVRHDDDVEDAEVVARLMDLTEQVFEQPMTDKSSIGVEEIPKS
ncbi:high mobility group nucleosome-binding domain-containing protein 5-like [Tripterygium wilfordii]|uniref:high mobility group nucleosome-binding domain-containing protein 5-like n=1 Tax=Tripterygium wilfordii TaxID=458696 RepID=UPI0018F8554E|nr:high mobility group nucleosome-binding domain-containing protein 5-like [Tripterygium wilfordii]